jgi:hypothetical protein
LRRADHSFSEVLPCVCVCVYVCVRVRACVILCDLETWKQGGIGQRWAVAPQNKKWVIA